MVIAVIGAAYGKRIMHIAKNVTSMINIKNTIGVNKQPKNFRKIVQPQNLVKVRSIN